MVHVPAMLMKKRAFLAVTVLCVAVLLAAWLWLILRVVLRVVVLLAVAVAAAVVFRLLLGRLQSL